MRSRVATGLAVVLVVAGLVNSVWLWVAPTRANEVSAFVTYPLAVLAFGFLVYRFFGRAAIRGHDEYVNQPPVPGPPTATVRCSGHIGSMSFRNTLVVAVYPDRLTIRPLLLGTRTIMASRLTAVELGWRRVTVEHTSGDLRSPVTLRVSTDHPARAAIERLAGSVSRPPRTG